MSIVSVHPKSIILVEMTNFNMIFHVVVSVWLKLETRPSALLNFGTANGKLRCKQTKSFQRKIRLLNLIYLSFIYLSFSIKQKTNMIFPSPLTFSQWAIGRLFSL